jgi:hypothetical protein
VRRHLTYSNIAATLALVIAIGGGTAAIAGVRIAPKNSVTTKSIRQNNVTSRDLTGIVRVTSSSSFNDPAPPDGTFGGGNASVSCPAGTRLISGGGGVDNSRAQVTNSAPVGEGWAVAASGDGTNTATITVVAKCLAGKAQKQGS